jgi:hypothetical protein
MGKILSNLHATLTWSLALALLLPTAAGGRCACAQGGAPTTVGLPDANRDHETAPRGCCRRKAAAKTKTHACCRARLAQSQPVGAKQAIAAESSACSSSSYQVAVCKCHQTDAPAPTPATTAGSAGHKHVTAAHLAPALVTTWVSTPASPHADGWDDAPPGPTSLERCILLSRFLI